MEHPQTYKIRDVWQSPTMRRVFMDIITNTQLKKCKQLKPLLIRKIHELVEANSPDRDIYAQLFHYVHYELARELRGKIQHKSRYRCVNRANKIVEFISDRGENLPPVRSVLDLGCGEGSITNVVGRLLGLKRTNIHGCDILNLDSDETTRLFTYRQLDENRPNELPYQDNEHEVIYAFMSLHHISNLDRTIAEVYRILRPGGLFIIREHDCVNDALAKVLDVVHGFYSMVWSNPQEKVDFESEYWACYRTATQLNQLILDQGFIHVLSTHRDDEPFPLVAKGKVVNPLKYYYAIYTK